MISREDIERLAKLKSEHGILSAYIRMDSRLRFMRWQAAIQFKGALKQAKRSVPPRWQEGLDRESAHVLNFLSNSEPPGHGFVIFSCRPEGLWEFLPLAVPVPNLVDIDTTTKTGLLAETLNRSPRFIVAVLQRDQARIYVAQQGIAVPQAQLATEVPGQHRQGGRSQMRFERHIEFHVSEHLKKVAAELKRIAEYGPYKLAVGGTEQNVDELLTMLADPIRKAYIGQFVVNVKHDTEQEILERAELLWNQREQIETGKVLDQVFDAAKSKARGVLGVEPTLNALSEEKVQTLVLADRLAIEGSVCTRCDYFSAQEFETCPYCGGEAEHRDLADRAVEKAILTGAETEVVLPGEARDRLLAEGGLGALLRY